MRIIQVRDVQEALGVEDGEQQVIVGLKELLQLSWDQSRLFANNQNNQFTPSTGDRTWKAKKCCLCITSLKSISTLFWLARR
jgi:hypothetical protein